MSTIATFFFLFVGCFGLAGALTTEEQNKFGVDSSYQVTQGTQNGATLSPSLQVTADDTTITMSCNHVPPHATASSYTKPITTYISSVTSQYQIPKSPAIAGETTCLPAGVVGIAVNGVSIFSAYSRPCTDAVVDEAIGFDDCDGHPQEQGTYHYHYKARCLETTSGSGVFVTETTAQQLYGVALDGFPIYNDRDASGGVIGNDKLDDCHGYDAGDGKGYRYIVNSEFPYIIGCFKGTPRSNIKCHCDASGVSGASDASGVSTMMRWHSGVGLALMASTLLTLY
mmetsp:Transcript_78017/g.202741  ORF Transcript_78017/g.202741 Transcript_78017/m.202741 type:complete len:284 (-) Transcript_78017:98-949(-)